MNIFDLLFIVLFLTFVVGMLVAFVFALLGRRKRAVCIVRRFGICAAIYLGIVFIVSAATPRHVLKVGDPQCNDDWCIAVEDVKRTRTDSTISHVVTLRVSSRARGRAQREKGVRVYLADAQRRRYEPVPDASALPFDTLLQPGESVVIARRFELPSNARGIGLVVDHAGGFPGCFIITENDWFHKPTIVQLE